MTSTTWRRGCGVLKINSEENPTDTFASYSDAQVMQKHVRMMGCEVG